MKRNLLAIAVLVWVACSSNPGSLGESYRTCASAAECQENESCFPGFKNGLCTKNCTTAADCGADVCIPTGGPNACTKRCSTQADCRSDLVCSPSGACGESLCDRVNACASDPAPSLAVRTQCKANLVNAAALDCYSEEIVVFYCEGDNTVCDATGRTDVAATGTNVAVKCADALSAKQACCALKPTGWNCPYSTPQAAVCADYVGCFEKTGGAAGSLDSTYGPAGNCWNTSQTRAATCTNDCDAGVSSLRTSHPDAGC